MYRTFIINAVLILAFIGLVIGAQRFLLRAPHIIINPTAIEFGNIDQKGGAVTKSVAVSNTGNKPLKINRLSTSCGCTIAKMDLTDLAPNTTRSLDITFDPMAHPDQFGPVTRVVYLQTSDSKNPEIEINVTGNVIPKK